MVQLACVASRGQPFAADVPLGIVLVSFRDLLQFLDLGLVQLAATGRLGNATQWWVVRMKWAHSPARAAFPLTRS